MENVIQKKRLCKVFNLCEISHKKKFFFQFFFFAKMLIFFPIFIKCIQLPSFQPLGNDEFFDNETLNTHIDYHTGISQTQHNSFISSCVHVWDSEFDQLYGFGDSVASGQGGVIYVYQCTLVSTNNRYRTNQAQTGGAVSCIFSAALFSRDYFDSNKCYSYGGAIYFQGYIKVGTYSDTHFGSLQIENSEFDSNFGGSMGGAVLVTDSRYCFVDQSLFEYNYAQYYGGVFHIRNTDKTIKSSRF